MTGVLGMLDRKRTQARTILAVVALAFVFVALPAIMSARAAVNIQEVRSDSGVTAWLVEDYSVPIVTISFNFEGGTSQDPAGKEGLANLMSGLFDEGAGELEADAFQQTLDRAGAEMSFRADRDAISGTMRMLAEKRDEAFGLLALALAQPRFDQAPTDRIRAQILSGIRASERDPNTQAQIEFAKALYGDHPYARRSEGTPESLAAIVPDDLKALHGRLFARDNLRVAVVGAIDAETLRTELDRLFGALPEKADLVAVPDVEPKLDQQVKEVYDLPQTNIHIAFPGVARDDPEFFAAYLMNHILGGGTFSSRLFDEVREKRGLAYGIGSGLSSSRHSNALMIGTATNSERAGETLQIIRDVIRKMAEDGPTEAELEDARRYLIGAYAINNLDSSRAIVSTLLGLQTENLGIDYIERRAGLIEAVTREQVAAAARRLLTVEPAVMLVGPDIENGQSGG